MSTKAWLLIAIGLSLLSCRKQKPSPPPPAETAPLGFDLLARLSGIWEGPVTSTTSVGDFPVWKVDLRPIHSAQISARNELDSANNIHLSFFVARYDNKPTLCFRNGGFFSGIERITYLFLDSTAPGYYRFIEPVSRGQRAYAELHFPMPDSLILAAYTNKLGTRPQPVLHMRWTARRVDTTAARPAIAHFQYPQPVVVRDLSQAFAGRTEAIYYSPIQNDPYPSDQQPYLGFLRASYQHHSSYTPDPDKFVILFTTTQPLVENFQYYPDRLRYISRYVRLPATQTTFFFPHVHPGSYYLYALYDEDENGTPSSGDWFSLMGTRFTLAPQDTAAAAVPITFRLP
ncbi:MAG: hypothetical protein KatS3mg025_0165 [Bacteroidia bacterium]|nr:MAG: hypothetical protein KatS3mg025_0165 [Bacteroidia bacterium]